MTDLQAESYIGIGLVEKHAMHAASVVPIHGSHDAASVTHRVPEDAYLCSLCCDVGIVDANESPVITSTNGKIGTRRKNNR